ncbi:MAG TPA: peptidase P60 [Burkholderiales bacterium]|nr:peptidase P60 [Burkholderiales bacterium]
MVTRAALVAEARAWLGTPFAHQQGVRGVATDCVGVVAGVPRALGLYTDIAIAPYGAQPDEARMRTELETHLDCVAFRDLRPADLLWFRSDVRRRHLGIVTGIDPVVFLHAFNRKDIARVVETRLDEFWRSRVSGCFRYRGLED